MKLYSFFNSSTSYRVRIALAIKGIDYEYEGVNIRIGEQLAADYLKLNPSKGVPVLDNGNGLLINQSLAVIEYLEQKFPEPPLLPGNAEQQAKIRAFAYGIACDIHPLNNLRVLKYLTGKLNVSSEAKQAWYAHWVEEGLAAAEQTLVAMPSENCCFGSKPTLADVCLIPQIANAQRFDCDLSRYPRLMKVYEHCVVQPEFIAAQPDKQPDFAD